MMRLPVADDQGPLRWPRGWMYCSTSTSRAAAIMRRAPSLRSIPKVLGTPPPSALRKSPLGRAVTRPSSVCMIPGVCDSVSSVESLNMAYPRHPRRGPSSRFWDCLHPKDGPPSLYYQSKTLDHISVRRERFPAPPSPGTKACLDYEAIRGIIEGGQIEGLFGRGTDVRCSKVAPRWRSACAGRV